MIRNILFDLDDTLLDFHKAERVALTETLRHFGIAPCERTLLRYHDINQSQWKLLEQGKVTRDELKVRRYRLLFAEIGVDRSPQDATRYYESRLGECCFFVDGAEALLRRLAGVYRSYIVTNGTAHVQESRIRRANIARYIDGVFISQHIGFEKPRVEFFDHCFARIPDFRKDETVIVGDSLSSDIQGGRNAGIATVWYDPAGCEDRSQVCPDYAIRRLAELPLLLKTL